MARALVFIPVAAFAVALAAAAFVVPFSSGPRVTSPLRRAALSKGAASGDFEPLTPEAPEVAAPEAPSFLKWVGAGVVAGLFFAVTAAAPQPAEAAIDFSQFSIKKSPYLENCQDNKKFHKKFKDQVYKITQRQKYFPKGGLVWNRWQANADSLKKEEAAYGGRLCGKKDGLPRTIVTGEAVRGSIVIPGLMFLYSAGWIGWTGREYLQRTDDKMKEINIDVPLAITCMFSGFAWPVNAWQDIVNGEFVAKDTDIWKTYD
jgi:hypothetical protein